MNFVQLLRKANDLKAQLTEGRGDLWVTRQTLQDVFHQLLLGDLESALDKKLEQELWNHVFKNHISTLQHKARDRMNPKRSEVQAMLSLLLDNASGFYIQLLQEICCAFNVQLACHVKAQRLGLFSETLPSPQKLVQPKTASCMYICQHCLVHLGDLARYRNDTQQAESYYCHAASLVPSNGQPYNQLAIVSATKGDQLSMAFYYIRSIAVKHPFPAAATNLQTTYAKLVDRDEVKIFKMREVELIHYFIKFHAIIYLATCEQDLQVASSIKDKLEENFRSHLSQEILTSRQLNQIAAINLFALHSIRQHVDNGERKTPGELSAVLGTQEGGAYAANKAQCWTLVMGFTFNLLQMMLHYAPQKSSEQPTEAWPALPAIKILLSWIFLQPGLFDDPVLSSKTGVWSKLARVLTSLLVDSQPQDNTSRSVPLPEDCLLDGFTPLQDSQSDLNFSQSKKQTWNRAAMNFERCYRLGEQGKWLAHHQPSLLKMETSLTSKLMFSSPLGDDLSSRRSSHHHQRQQRNAKPTPLKGIDVNAKQSQADKGVSRKTGRDGGVKKDGGKERGEEGTKHVNIQNKTIAVQAIMPRPNSDVNKQSSSASLKGQDRSSYDQAPTNTPSGTTKQLSRHSPSSVPSKEQEGSKRHVQWQSTSHAHAQEPSYYPLQRPPPQGPPPQGPPPQGPPPQGPSHPGPPQSHHPQGHLPPGHPPPGHIPQGNPPPHGPPLSHGPSHQGPSPAGLPPGGSRPPLGPAHRSQEQMYPPPPMGPPPQFPGHQNAPRYQSAPQMQPPPPPAPGQMAGPPPSAPGQMAPPGWQQMHRDAMRHMNRDGPPHIQRDVPPPHLGRDGIPSHMPPPKLQIPPHNTQGPSMSSPNSQVGQQQGQQWQRGGHAVGSGQNDRQSDRPGDGMADISMWNATQAMSDSRHGSHSSQGPESSPSYQQHGFGHDTSPLRSPIGQSPQFRMSPTVDDYNLPQNQSLKMPASQAQSMPNQRRLSNPQTQMHGFSSAPSYDQMRVNFPSLMSMSQDRRNPGMQRQQIPAGPPPQMLDNQGANLLELLTQMQKQISPDMTTSPTNTQSRFSPEQVDRFRPGLDAGPPGLPQKGMTDPPGYRGKPDSYTYQQSQDQSRKGNMGLSNYYQTERDAPGGMVGYDPICDRPQQHQSAFRKINRRQDDDDSLFLRADLEARDSDMQRFHSRDRFSYFSQSGGKQEKQSLPSDSLKFDRDLFTQQHGLQEPSQPFPYRRASGGLYEGGSSFPTTPPTSSDQGWSLDAGSRDDQRMEDALLSYFPAGESGSQQDKMPSYSPGWKESDQMTGDSGRRSSHDALFTQSAGQNIFNADAFMEQKSGAFTPAQHNQSGTPNSSYYSNSGNKGRQPGDDSVFSGGGSSGYSLFSSPSPWSSGQEDADGSTFSGTPIGQAPMAKTGDGLGGSLGLKWRGTQLSSSPTSSLLPERLQSIWSSPMRSEQSPLEKILGHKMSLEQQKPDT